MYLFIHFYTCHIHTFLYMGLMVDLGGGPTLQLCAWTHFLQKYYLFLDTDLLLIYLVHIGH